MTVDASRLADRIEGLTGMDRLLPALGGLDPAYLVGGAVRDLLRGETSVDLDVAVEGDAHAVARELRARLGGELVEHSRFGTARVETPDLVVDLAATRSERYPHPGALPEVEPAPLADDLARRDFAVNAMAAALLPGSVGQLIDPHGGRSDLEAGVIRVLHERSFVDDPTRLVRAVRYEARLGFAMDAETERLARDAAVGLARISGERVGAELLLLLAEPEAPRAVGRMGELGLDRAIAPELTADPELVAGATLGAIETGADRVLAGLAALASGAGGAAPEWLGRIGLRREELARVSPAATGGPQLAQALREPLTPSRLRALLDPEPPEALALALAEGAPAEPVLRYVTELADVRLEIAGHDLIAAGVPESPAIGRALERTLALKLDGELSGRSDELAAALALARSDRGAAS